MRQTLREVGGRLVLAVPKAFADQNGLGEGSRVRVHVHGGTMTVEASALPHYSLAELLAQMRDEVPRVPGWEEMPAVGRETF